MTREALDAAEADSSADQMPLCRFEVVGGKLRRCADKYFFGPTGGHLCSLYSALSVVHKHAPLPDGLRMPRNPLNFSIIESGRKRVSDVFIDKNSATCT